MQKIVIVIDCPEQKSNKKWVERELQKTQLPISVIDCKYTISHIEQRGTIGKILSRLITMLQCIKVMLHSNKGDIVFCWSQWAGILLNLLPGASKRKIISYNWLTPIPNPKTRFMYARALSNPNLITVINSEDNRKLIEQAYGKIDRERMLYIPDVFDDSENFADAKFSEDNRYCFTGGRANRDWGLFCEIAAKLPEKKFVAVAVRSDWDESLIVPDNVELYFDLPADNYYNLLSNAYLAIYPLKENRVSGLVNIVKGTQMGRPVLTTDLPVTRMYYPMSRQEQLIPVGQTDLWCEQIRKLYTYSEEEYITAVKDIQEHIKKDFAPERAGNILREQIRKWEVME